MKTKLDHKTKAKKTPEILGQPSAKVLATQGKERQKEPDQLAWWYEDLPCLILRNTLGALCGYVGLPTNHRYFGKNHDKIRVQVHGGLTFSDTKMTLDNVNLYYPVKRKLAASNEAEFITRISGGYWWVGFDCCHANDLVPGLEMLFKSIMPSRPKILELKYRNIKYVKGQVIKLAKQLYDQRKK